MPKRQLSCAEVRSRAWQARRYPSPVQAQSQRAQPNLQAWARGAFFRGVGEKEKERKKLAPQAP